MSTQATATMSAPSVDADAFAFVQELATELSSGKVDMPSFPEIAVRVRQVLSDDAVSPDQVVRVIGSEPALAARLLQIANSAALNFSGRAVTELRTAVARMGFNMVRSAAIAFAMSQLKKADSLKGLEKQLEVLWSRSTTVAALSHVIARRFSNVNPDMALLAGLLHGIGRLYILTRASRHPKLFSNEPAYHAIERDWHTSIAKALLENWDMAPEIVLAVSEYEMLDREHRGAPDLSDVLSVGHLLASYRDYPETLELNMQGVSACKRLQLDTAAYAKLLGESSEEIAAVQSALGR
jgi:HD-like signal output (HDOD) protein